MNIKAFRKIREFFADQECKIPPGIDDEVAKKTYWTPLVGWTINFCTHKLVVTIHQEKVEFRPTRSIRLFCLSFVLVGIGLISKYFYDVYQESWMSDNANIFNVFLGLIFAAAGILIYGSISTIGINKRLNVISKEAPRPFKSPLIPTLIEKFNTQQVLSISSQIDASTPPANEDHSSQILARIDEVYALQLISQKVRGRYNYTCYELNLVLSEGVRVNVVKHANSKIIRADSRLLSDFISKPLWDAANDT